MSASAINVILEDASRTYKELPKSPVDYGLGLKLVVNTMRYNIALYRAMLEVDISDQDAKSHIAHELYIIQVSRLTHAVAFISQRKERSIEN